MTLTGSNFSNNAAGPDCSQGLTVTAATAAAGAATYSSGAVTLSRAAGVFGGGAVAANGVAVSISGSAFQGNSCNGAGGALLLAACTLSSAAPSSFTSNVAQTGGAVALLDSSASLGAATLVANSASATPTRLCSWPDGDNRGAGGALVAAGRGNLTLDGSLFGSNVAPGSGGAVALYDFIALAAAGAAIEGNSAAAGGALSLSDGASASLQGGRLQGNAATAGGAVQLVGLAASVALGAGLVVANNSAVYGGVFGMLQGASPSAISLSKVALADNSADTGWLAAATDSAAPFLALGCSGCSATLQARAARGTEGFGRRAHRVRARGSGA